MLCDGLSRFGKYQSPWWLGNYCLEFGVFEQNILRNLEHLSLGISSALKMDDKSCQGVEIWQNEDGYKTFPWETFFLSKLVEHVESVKPGNCCQYSGLKMFNTEYFDKG